MARIDLNSDLGESFGPWPMGDDAAMLQIVTSANVACGGHASDPDNMFETLRLARENGVVVGAHPGFADLLGFGRRIIPMKPAEIGRMCVAQIGALVGMGALVGHPVRYVKPHGALGNLAAADMDVARAIVGDVKAAFPELAFLAISGGALDVAAREAGCDTYSEIFADRGYLSNGQLVPRGTEGAMIHDAGEAAARLVKMLETGLMPVIDGDPIPLAAQSICVHGDSPTAVAMAAEVRDRLRAEGIVVEGFLDP